MLRSFCVSIVAVAILLGAPVLGQQAVPGSVASNKKHVHAEHGPHQGQIVEIGKEEYHAEIVVDESKKQLMVFLLDKDVKGYVAIDAPFIAVNLLINGKPLQIKLKAKPQAVDQKGLSSCFGDVSPELIDALHNSKSDPKLTLKIRNKSYAIKIPNHHDHAGHDHAGHDHASAAKKNQN